MSSTSAFRFVPRLESFEERLNLSTVAPVHLHPTLVAVAPTAASRSDLSQQLQLALQESNNASGQSNSSQRSGTPTDQFALNYIKITF